LCGRESSRFFNRFARVDFISTQQAHEPTGAAVHFDDFAVSEFSHVESRESVMQDCLDFFGVGAHRFITL